MSLPKADGKEFSVDEWQVTGHPQYQRSQVYYDVAVVFLPEPLGFDDRVQPICLPKSESTDAEAYRDDFALLLGKFQVVKHTLS